MSDPRPRIFDRTAYLLHRARAARRIGDNPLAREAVAGIADRLAAVMRDFDQGLDVDGRPDAEILRARARNWTGADFDADETLAVAPQSFDLAVSVLCLHAMNDLPGALVQIRRALRPDGLFVGALFGGETLKELRDSLSAAEIEVRGGVSPRVAPFADVRDLGGLLQRAGFALPVADVERTVVRYRDFAQLVGDLRGLGETNALAERSLRPITRALLAAVQAHYAAYHADADGRLRATFDIVYLTGWAPDASQQTPLRPGSAKARLAEALNTTEEPAGEKAPPQR